MLFLSWTNVIIKYIKTKIAVDEKQWGSLSQEERKSRLEKYVNSGMDCKKDLSKCKRNDRDDSSTPSTPVISMTASRTKNVHLHLRIACIRARYPEFPASALVVPLNFSPTFSTGTPL
ncbi:Hypothetical predicted protein [Paramuricea clavata]|uniref:Uncharacterized protein n=1 Tax=Paramuricea clavata TaxID=317549 RepID=A0A7D9HNB6_PARCT|nr:Hypothetical predicted protein [Paramuricea clavata]